MDKSLFRDMWTTIKSKNSWHGIISNIKKDGSKYTVKASIFPILNDKKEITEYIAIRHKATEMLKLNAKFFTIHQTYLVEIFILYTHVMMVLFSYTLWMDKGMVSHQH